ncbi:hypothetical protein BaRGS_00014400 [Batillaria attramentaria]|uniref:Protein MMS22-like n=1 Tax=Batillaria attramentaria TaxID=370345 RepID=A0ABD0L4G4_9CAEN
MTPPVSPRSQQKEKNDESETLMDFEDSPFFLDDLDEQGENQAPKREPACFHCSGEVFPYKGAKLMFADNGVLPAYPGPVVELFDFTFIYTDLRDKMDRLFMFASVMISEVILERGIAGIPQFLFAGRKNGSRVRPSARDLKRIPAFTSGQDEFGEEHSKHKFLQGLLRELHLLLVHAGRISDNFTLSAYSMDQLSGVHHSLHQHLELYWYLLHAFSTLATVSNAAAMSVDERLCQSTPGEDDPRPPLDQLISIIITDLVSLAVPLFNKLSAHEWLRTSPFACGCLAEFWVLLLQLVTKMKEKWDTESFWVRLHQVLRRLWEEDSSASVVEDDVLDTDVFVLDISPRPTNSLGFSLWFVTHLSHLFIFDASGNQCKPDPTQSCVHIVQVIMERTLRTVPKEEGLRSCLRCCLSIAALWPPSTQLVTLLWEHFFRRLNDRFQLHFASIEGLAVIRVDQETSFHLFLQLLARLLTQSGALSEWRSIKGRFYSKFHQRRMQELTETGLHNLACLFLTLGLCVDAEEVATKLSAFYDMLDPTSLTSRLRAQVWLGALAMTQLLAKEKKNFSFLAEKLASSFDSISKQLSDAYFDYSQRQELSPLITLYIDGVRDVFEHSELEGCENMFIGEGIASFLKSCGENDLRHTFSSLDSIIMRIRCVVAHWKENQPMLKDSHLPAHKAVAERLWRHVFPFVCDHAQTLTPPLCLADLAMSFTHLSLDLQFTRDTVSSSIACHYLSQVLTESALREAAIAIPGPTALQPPNTQQSESLKVQQSEIVKSWWHCVMLMPPASQSLLELTEQVMTLPEVENLRQAGRSAGVGDELGAVRWKVFLKCIGAAYQNAEGLLERQRVRAKVLPYFASVPQQVAPVVRTMSPLETVLTMYRAVGSLVKHCAPLLYVQSKPCPLPDIIKSLILPASVFTSEKPLHSYFLAAVRETLHLFIEGLGRLDYRRDSFIQRQIRNIVTQYLPRFPLRVLRGAKEPELVYKLVVEQLQKSSSPVSHEVAKHLEAVS